MDGIHLKISPGIEDLGKILLSKQTRHSTDRRGIPRFAQHFRAARNGTSSGARSCRCCKCRMQARGGCANLADVPCGSHLYWRHSPDISSNRRSPLRLAEHPKEQGNGEATRPQKKPCDPEFPTHLVLAG